MIETVERKVLRFTTIHAVRYYPITNITNLHSQALCISQQLCEIDGILWLVQSCQLRKQEQQSAVFGDGSLIHSSSFSQELRFARLQGCDKLGCHFHGFARNNSCHRANHEIVGANAYFFSQMCYFPGSGLKIKRVGNHSSMDATSLQKPLLH